jgi:hypothetical protein
MGLRHIDSAMAQIQDAIGKLAKTEMKLKVRRMAIQERVSEFVEGHDDDAKSTSILL